MSDVKPLDPEYLAKVTDEHLQSYLRTDGRDGHVFDLTDLGGYPYATALILRTIGRKSGEPRLVPLIYGPWGDEFVVIGSKGGAATHPAWYDNMIENPDIAFQIGGKRWLATFRLAEGAEREETWEYMATKVPPYRNYEKAAVGRQIPVVLLKPVREVDDLISGRKA